MSPPNTLSIPLGSMPNVNKDDLFSGISLMGKLRTAYYYIINSDFRKMVSVQDWYDEWENSSEGKEVISKLPVLGTPSDETALKCLSWVRNSMFYAGDTSVWKMSEYWATPDETLSKKEGDCFAGYEEIYTAEGIKRIDTIQVGDSVLSYDFVEKKFVYKPVVAHWSKGPLELHRIHFRNGQHLDVSKDHPMWVRQSQGESNYVKQLASEIDLARWWKRKVPVATKIPYSTSTPRFEKELYRVIGHFIAEGWSSGKVGSSGYELHEYITPILDRLNIPFSEGTNGSGVPMINFLKSDFKTYLKGLKTSSFDINLYEELITLPRDYLEELLYGMWLGDGTKNIGKNQYNKSWVYSTSSVQLAGDIQRIGLHLGRTFHLWKQNNHGGVGTKPIYRITYNPESHFLKEHGLADLSEVSISFIESLDEVEMYDITVEDTHTVVMKNGIVTHQCEDGALLLYTLLKKSGLQDNQVFICAGNVVGGGHCYVSYLSFEDACEYILDWCYWPEDSMNKMYGLNDNYYRGSKEWFRFNSSGCYVTKQG